MSGRASQFGTKVVKIVPKTQIQIVLVELLFSFWFLVPLCVPGLWCFVSGGARILTGAWCGKSVGDFITIGRSDTRNCMVLLKMVILMMIIMVMVI